MLQPAYAETDEKDEKNENAVITNRAHVLPTDAATAETLVENTLRDLQGKLQNNSLPPELSINDDELKQSWTFSSVREFLQHVRDTLHQPRPRQYILTTSVAVSQGVIIGWGVSIASGIWTAAYVGMQMWYNKPIGETALRWNKKIPLAAPSSWYAMELVYSIGLLAMGGHQINASAIQLFKLVSLTFAAQGIIEVAAWRHRLKQEEEIKQDDPLREKKKNRIDAAADYKKFLASSGTAGLALLDLPLNAWTLADLVNKIPGLSPSLIETLSAVEISTIGFGAMTVAGIIYYLWTLKYEHGGWKLFFQHSLKRSEAVFYSIFKLSHWLNWHRWSSSGRCQAVWSSF